MSFLDRNSHEKYLNNGWGCVGGISEEYPEELLEMALAESFEDFYEKILELFMRKALKGFPRNTNEEFLN